MQIQKETQTPIGVYLIILFGAQLAIGAAAIFARYAMHGAGPLTVSALRLTIASLAIVLINRHMKRRVSVSHNHEIVFAFCGLALSVHFGTWMASLLFTSVAIATLLVSTSPIWTALYDVFVLRRKPTLLFWIGFVAAAFGTVLIVTATSGEVLATHGFADLIGEVLSAAGGIAFAAYLIAIRSLSSKYPTLVVVGRTYSWAAVFLWLGALLFHEQIPCCDFKSWLGILGLALVSQLLGHTGINASLKRFTPNVVAFSTLLEPVFAAVLASLIFGETLSTQMITGSLILLGAVSAILCAQSADEDLEFAKAAPEL